MMSHKRARRFQSDYDSDATDEDVIEIPVAKQPKAEVSDEVPGTSSTARIEVPEAPLRSNEIFCKYTALELVQFAQKSPIHREMIRKTLPKASIKLSCAYENYYRENKFEITFFLEGTIPCEAEHYPQLCSWDYYFEGMTFRSQRCYNKMEQALYNLACLFSVLRIQSITILECSEKPIRESAFLEIVELHKMYTEERHAATDLTITDCDQYTMATCIWLLPADTIKASIITRATSLEKISHIAKLLRTPYRTPDTRRFFKNITMCLNNDITIYEDIMRHMSYEKAEMISVENCFVKYTTAMTVLQQIFDNHALRLTFDFKCSDKEHTECSELLTNLNGFRNSTLSLEKLTTRDGSIFYALKP